MDNNSKEKVIDNLKKVLINSYSLYLKTQNYHWNVVGPQFHSLHLMFESQYIDLAEAIDVIAERIRALGSLVPATLEEYNNQKLIKDGNLNFTSNQMLEDLVEGQKEIIKFLEELINVSENAKDSGTADMATLRIEIHQKNLWMLSSSINK